MAILLHEIWEYESDGMTLNACCLAGPMGDGCRQQLGPNVRLLNVFDAGSHFEAMTIYNAFLRRGAYTTNQAWDYESYPDEWLAEQQERAG